MASRVESERIAGLDVWRSLLMSGGLFVHSFVWLPPTHLFFVVEIISQAFRMGVFFALSGFLSALAVRRSSPGRWLSARLRQVGVPAITGVLLLSPSMWWFAATRAGSTDADAPMVFEWGHTWFLWGLLLCSAALWWLDRRVGAGERLIGMVSARRPLELILGTAIATTALFALVPPLLGALLPPRLAIAYRLLQLIAGYLPTFFFGVVTARSEVTRERLLASWRLCTGIVGAAAVAYALVCADLVGPLENHVRVLGAAVCPPAVFVLVLRSALGIKRVPAVLQSLSNASYTIYLLHLPAAVAINTRMAPLQLEPVVQYAVTIALTGAGSWLFHLFVVRRSATAALLLNGRLPRGRKPASMALAGGAGQ